MQISRMPIPADDCVNSEMSADTNSSDPKNNDLETTTKVNGDNHKKLNGNALDDSMEVDEINKTSELKCDVTVKKENEEEKNEDISENVTESLSKITDELIKNGTTKEQESEDTVEESNQDKTSKVDNEKLEDNEGNKEIKPMEIDNEDKQIENEITKSVKIEIVDEADDIISNVIIKKEPQEVEEPGTSEITDVSEDVIETEKTKKLDDAEVSFKEEVIKNSELEINPVNGKTRLGDELKIVKSTKVNQKVPEDEDMSSEISTDTLSPKQVYIQFKFYL